MPLHRFCSYRSVGGTFLWAAESNLALGHWPSSLILFCHKLGHRPSSLILFCHEVGHWPSSLILFCHEVGHWPSSLILFCHELGHWPSSLFLLHHALGHWPLSLCIICLSRCRFWPLAFSVFFVYHFLELCFRFSRSSRVLFCVPVLPSFVCIGLSCRVSVTTPRRRFPWGARTHVTDRESARSQIDVSRTFIERTSRGGQVTCRVCIESIHRCRRIN